MNQQTNTFPLFFTLERVENGYILKCKEESTGLSQEAKWRKEIVTDDKIDQRIGHLLHLDTMKKEVPLTFFVEAITENTYKFDDDVKPDELMKAKLQFYQYQLKNYREDQVLALKIPDSNTIEIYGSNAEKLSINDSSYLIRVMGIHMMRFMDNKEGRKLLGTFRPQVTLLTVTEEKMLEWYNSHKIDNKSIETASK